MKLQSLSPVKRGSQGSIWLKLHGDRAKIPVLPRPVDGNSLFLIFII